MIHCSDVATTVLRGKDEADESRHDGDEGDGGGGGERRIEAGQDKTNCGINRLEIG